jgi:hypothetical protein
MGDLQKMKDPALKDRIQHLSTREAIGCFIAMASSGALLFGAFAGAGIALSALFFAGGMLGLNVTVAAFRARRRCEEERDRRHPPPPGQVITRAQPAPETAVSLPGPANDFNPAAATILEKDIKSMAPLRLKLKPEMYSGLWGRRI